MQTRCKSSDGAVPETGKSNWWRRWLASRYGHVAIFAALWLGVHQAMRLVLAAWAWPGLSHQPAHLAGMLLCGLVYDLAAGAFTALPLVLFGLVAPRRWLASRWHRWLAWGVLFVALYALLFSAVAEWFFWEEFESRFNFIAVDYLIYTKEVVGNIRESYPLPAILGALAAVTALAVWAVRRTGWMQTWLAGAPNGRARWWPAGAALLAAGVAFVALSNERVPFFGNARNQELARNGPYSLFAAFRENSLSYDRFYPTRPVEEALHALRPQLAQTNATFVSEDPTNITRHIIADGAGRRWNVIQITVESLSASFLGVFGNTNELTPNLDRLYREGVAFQNLYATGNRTVRGMEALTLAVPPTPGSSIVRRPRNANLFSLGSVFRGRGYDTAFLYSGFGCFDNMNAYFAANGYRVVDRASVRKEDITYATVWGACDEDLYRWTLREADADFAAGKPFHFFVMTTSNHRPYGFPEGRIDLPPGKRLSAVKYTDYAIGQLLTEARMRPWFTNTLFVIVADHCANSAGKTALPPAGYRIPAVIWNPTLLAPQTITQLCSQIDLPPTLLGLMNWTYDSRFFGRDVLRVPPGDERALIATYQRLGYLLPDRLAILEPVKRRQAVRLTGDGETPLPGPEGDALVADAIAAYQSASFLFHRGLNHE